MQSSSCITTMGLHLMQVYDRRKRLKRVMHLLEPILSVSFLNDTGDIVAALNRKLVVIRADSYKFLTADEMSMLVTEHAKSEQQALRQTPAIVLRAAMQLAKSGSSKRLQPAQQQHLSQVGSSVTFSCAWLIYRCKQNTALVCWIVRKIMHSSDMCREACCSVMPLDS